MSRLFETVLIANRGEISVRVARTLRRMGIRSVAVYTDADDGALHTRTADVALRIGSYLSVDDVIGAARQSGAQAIHPGYGFLSENPALARGLADAGIAFIGPPAASIEAMGDKISAKATVAAAGVSVVPGSDGTGLTDDQLAAAAVEVGFPVLLKPSAGGGGKGMRLVDAEADLGPAIESARREARSSFGDDTLLLERFITNPRHIEIQVLADTHGSVVHLGERECSLQRRHQKIVEEAPSPLLTPDVRQRMGAQAVDAAKACGYVGAGTVEFIVSSDRPDEFFFMEMNTRLQVEHPVTEMVYGVDLVEQQVRVAAGEPLPFEQADLVADGHAVEVRIYAEDAARGFLPTGGTVHRFITPDDADRVVDSSQQSRQIHQSATVRVDAGIADGSVVGSSFDPMLVKLIVHGADRGVALDGLDAALSSTAVLGVTTNVGFLRRLLALEAVRAGDLDTGLVERELDGLSQPPRPDLAVIAAAFARHDEATRGSGPWYELTGWRHGDPTSTHAEFDVVGGERLELFLDDVGGTTLARSGGVRGGVATWSPAANGSARLVLDGEAHDVILVRVGDTTHVAIDGDSWTLRDVVHRGDDVEGAGTAGDGAVRSPMPGTVIDIAVSEGDEVSAGQAVAIVEAMKMEHTLSAPIDGVVETVHAAAGASVALDAPLLTISATSD